MHALQFIEHLIQDVLMQASSGQEQSYRASNPWFHRRPIQLSGLVVDSDGETKA